jgi:microcin C transport system substrate-binding protein
LTKLTRRRVLQVSASATALPLSGLAMPTVLRAQEKQWRHGLSLFGDLKNPPDFKHFNYVNPQAPKGGTIRTMSIGSFDSFNLFSYRGDKPPIAGAAFDSLFSSSLDEAGTMYGLIASHASYPDDFSSVTFKLNPKARFHDGSPVTPEDVIWSMQAQRSAHPHYGAYYKNITRAEQSGDHEVTFFFSGKGNRELPNITSQLTVLSKKWWMGKNAKGDIRDIKKTTLEPLLGNGAYKVSDFKTGEWVVVERVKDYWAKDLPVNVGQHNFDRIKQLFFRDQNVALEAFKGDQYDWREENNSKTWATQYNFPAVKKGRVIVEKIEQKNGQGMQSFAFNLRRKHLFGDPRVRLAFNYAFDFEWSNKNLFFGQYKRTASFFSNSELASKGLPSADELKILEPLRGKIPDEVFTKEYKNPESNTPIERRENLRKAFQLLSQAGWKPGKDRILRNKDGQKMEFEILLISPAFERIVLPYAKQLKRLGAKVSVRTVDAAQYIKRLKTFDFDCIVGSWRQSLSPGNEQRDFWTSRSADINGSSNYLGIKDPAIDQLVERLIFATSRSDLIAASRALDRVLLWNHFLVPMWHIAYDRTARWNRFGRPDKIPDHSNGFPTIWWWDAEKAAKTKAAK